MHRLLTLITALLLAVTAGATHRALIVAVGNYPSSSGWPRLNSTNDMALLKPVMQKHGFVVTTLTDAQATKAGIVSAIKCLTAESRPGDHVWLHLSGHGQQVEDRSGDENDALDEAFVPFDAHRRYSKTYRGQNHLTDDVLNPLLVALRKRLGGNGELLVTIDACHSGDSYRSGTCDAASDSLVGKCRGVSEVLSSNKLYVRRGRPATMRPTSLSRSKGYGAVTMLAACQPNENNYEYVEPRSRRSYGALSYALWEALTRAKQQPSLRDIAHWVMSYNNFYMRKYQNPHLFEE